MSSVADRLAELGLELPAPIRPVGSYVTAVQTGSLLHLSGHLGRVAGEIVTGRVGADREVVDGQRAARGAALDLLSTTAAALGSLEQVARIVKVVGMVCCTAEFTQQPAVVNGASDFLVDVFGERGRHARSAVGVAALPLGALVEIEMIVEIAGLSPRE